MELTLSVDGCTTNAIELERTDIAICEIGGDATEDRDMALRPSRNRLPPGAVSGQRCAARADTPEYERRQKGNTTAKRLSPTRYLANRPRVRTALPLQVVSCRLAGKDRGHACARLRRAPVRR